MKTIEKAATHFSEDIRENSLSGNNAGKEQYKVGRKIGFKAGVEFAQRWIPIEEELPEQFYEDGETKQVLLKHPNGFISTGIYDHSVKGWYNDITNRGFMNATHWRPIELK